MVKKTFVNDGFAVWLVGNTTKSDIHINEWFLPPDGTYIDFGIRIYEAKQVEAIGIFIPYDISESEVIDLADKFADEKIARGIFNTLCSINKHSDSQIIDIEYNNRKENIIELELFHMKLEKIDTGTKILFDTTEVNKIITQNETYIRFRIPHKSMCSLLELKGQSIRSRFASPVISNQYNYVLRVNEVRTLPIKIRCIPALKEQNIQKIIVTFSANTKYDVDESGCHKVRQLEKDLYCNYVPSGFECNNVFAYQWLIEQKERYNFNLKIQKEDISIKSLLGYVIIVIALSATGSAVWEGILKLINFIK